MPLLPLLLLRSGGGGAGHEPRGRWAGCSCCAQRSPLQLPCPPPCGFPKAWQQLRALPQMLPCHHLFQHLCPAVLLSCRCIIVRLTLRLCMAEPPYMACHGHGTRWLARRALWHAVRHALPTSEPYCCEWYDAEAERGCVMLCSLTRATTSRLSDA